MTGLQVTAALPLKKLSLALWFSLLFTIFLELNGDCSTGQPECCDNLTCFTYNSSTSICLNCTAAGDDCETV